jgi:NADH-quinone oxidoreductase subunit C
MRVTDVRDVPLAEWTSTVERLRDEGFVYFDWLTAVDQSDVQSDGGPDTGEAGLDLVCHLLAPDEPRHLRTALLRTRVPEGATAPSLTPVFPGAAWHERETFEMFGLEFAGFQDHSDLGLRPLLLPEGFVGHPLRKSFVLPARASKPWPGAKEPGEGHEAKAPSRRRVQAPGVPGPEWGPR